MRSLHKLSDVKAQSRNLKPGRHSDGGGLFLNVSKTGTKSWLFIWSYMGTKGDGSPVQKRREMGLGGYPAVSLASARSKAKECSEAVAEGRDPIEEKKRAAEPTFAECTDRFLASMESQWRNAKHRQQWRNTLTHYCKPIGSKRVSQISTDDVLRILSPIWKEKNETASRLRGRIERVLDYAKAHGWRTGENPAMWRGHLRNVLPARLKLQRGHHAAMPYADVPAFVERLQASQAMAARALEFLILTAARSGEVLGARWDEIDLEDGLWTVPAYRMKAGKAHRVPLTDRALAILKPLNELRTGDFVFAGNRPDRPLSGMAMAMLLRRMNEGSYTVHGFRSAFRQWVAEQTSFQREVAEAALAHTVGNAVERAYQRGDMLEKRRALMEAWSHFMFAYPTAKILKFHG